MYFPHSKYYYIKTFSKNSMPYLPFIFELTTLLKRFVMWPNFMSEISPTLSKVMFHIFLKLQIYAQNASQVKSMRSVDERMLFI